MKIRKIEDIRTTHVEPGDTIELTYREEVGVLGQTIGRRTVVCKDKIKKLMTLNKVVIFDVEAGDFGIDIKGGIGGAFLST